MKTLNLELTLFEALELKSAIMTRINTIAADTRSSVEYRIQTIQDMIPIYDKLVDIIENKSNK